MKKILAAVALIVSAVAITVAQPASAEGTCPGTHLSAGGATTFTYTAPEGYVITSYCVKAGSEVQGDGPEIHVVDPPATSITFSHSSGKSISHFSVTLTQYTTTTTTTTTTTITSTSSTSTTSTLPQCPQEPCGTNPNTLPTTTSTTLPGTTTSSTTSTSAPSSTTSTVVDTSTSTTTPTSSVPTATTTSTSTTTTTTSTTTTTLPETIDVGAVSTVCSRDVPLIVATFGNQPALDGMTGTISFYDVNGTLIEVRPFTFQSGETLTLLYPGATVDAAGNATDWPGWMLNADGFWVTDPSDALWREGLTLVAEINPTATATVSYPPETAACSSPEGPFGPPPNAAPPGTLVRTE